jgi:hypothetical protein
LWHKIERSFYFWERVVRKCLPLACRSALFSRLTLRMNVKLSLYVNVNQQLILEPLNEGFGPR